MLQQIITLKKNIWLESPDCSIKFLIDYIRSSDKLRDTQIEAVEQYLFLKIQCENKPLWQLFAEGFFLNGDNLSILHINQAVREFLESNISALALFEFARMKKNGKTLLPDLEKLIIEKTDQLDYESIIKAIFYNVNYADYLFSLPMGAGKTFLMAAFMYLDLYFAQLEPNNKVFAHNFIVLVPSGLKSSIIPSLRSIENFDPTWVIQEPAASNLKKLLRFEVLDQPKSGKKSNKARNPNAQKVNQYISQQDLMGLVLLVNAEKVILDRIDVVQEGETIKVDFHETEEEKDKYANELRNLIGKIPNLEIMIDEVHHAATDEVKLRQVVNKWNSIGNVTTVLGFSGTPYLASPDSVSLIDNASLRFSQITNTVYYYPLIEGIKSFLKKPMVKIAYSLQPMQIIEKGVEDFYAHYKNTKYENGSIAKLAIYCGKIERLEQEIYPALTKLIAKYGDTDDNILKYHKGNKEFKLQNGSELEYISLDQPFSNKRIILLVQVGKEGWDCRSLTGVILSNKGDCPTNMVLQTSCRCLRQVDKHKEETALIWLNELNAITLNKQLKEEQHTSIDEINQARKESGVDEIQRFSRMKFLDLPIVDFYQLKVEYKTIAIEENPNTEKKLIELLNNISEYKSSAIIKTKRNFDEDVIGGTTVLTEEGMENASIDSWLTEIAKESFNTITYNELKVQKVNIENILRKITYKQEHRTVYNNLYDRSKINSKVRLAFIAKRSLETEIETIPTNAQLLIAEKLNPFPRNDKFFPTEVEVQRIIKNDGNAKREKEIPDNELEAKIKALHLAHVEACKEMGMEHLTQSFQEFKKQFYLPFAVQSKNHTFHYLPYNFNQSLFEKETLIEILRLNEFKNQNLEVYYNGERGLTEFEIKCFALEGKYWRNIGKYTPDFLIVKRDKEELHKILILETKGEGFASKPDFVKKKNYVESEFLKTNNEKFGYKRFDFLYLQDDEPMPSKLAKLKTKFVEFFNN